MGGDGALVPILNLEIAVDGPDPDTRGGIGPKGVNAAAIVQLSLCRFGFDGDPDAVIARGRQIPTIAD
jgi:hypothetical protein